ncbi:MAG TPA: hypothetical protein DCS43_11605 [Verrucomicrobia bacterium]|nr:hypothetical protein [Verrucomicrobiota bacterium]
MRPLRLSLQAIGPFNGLVDIDFEKIGANELFLIHGKTGSGKTTLFDAICYALYSKVPSGREGSLKSDFAKETDKPFVEFTFALKDVRYVAYRQWAYKVPLKTKDGTKGCPESCTFSKINADGSIETLASSKSQMNVLVQERLGLDVNQFSQVVLLPQGEFRQLLLASSQDREVLMEKLFDASLYDGVQAWFDAEMKRFEGEGRDATARRKTYLEQVYGMIPEDRRPGDDAVFGVQAVDGEIGILRAQIETAGSDVAALMTAADASRSTLEAARQLSKDLGELARRAAEEAKLKDEQARIEPLGTSLRLARIAASLLPEQTELDRKESAVAGSRKRLADTTLAYEVANARKRGADEQVKLLPDLEMSVSMLATVDGQAKELRNTLQTMTGLQTRLAVVTKDMAESFRQQQAVEKGLAELTSRLGLDRGARDKLQASEVDLASLCSRLEKLQKGVATAGRIAKQTQFLVALKASSAGLESRKAAAAEALAALRERWNRNAAGVLAQGLQDGDACPVCGSPEHPRPARLADATATQDAIEAAELGLEQTTSAAGEAAIAVEKAATVLDSETATLRDLEQELGEAVCEAAVASTTRQMDAERARQNALKKLDEGIYELETKRIPKGNAMLAGIKAKIASLTTELDQLGIQIAEQKAVFTRQLQPPIADRLAGRDVSPDSIEELIKDAAKEASVLVLRMEGIKREHNEAGTELAGLESGRRAIGAALEQAELELKQRQHEMIAKLQASPFGDVEGLKKAYQPHAWIEATEARIKQHQEAGASVRAIIAELEKRVDKREDPDMEALEQRDAEHQSKLKEATAALHRLQHTEGALSKLAVEIRAMDAQFQRVEARMRVLGRLAEQVGGKGQPRISLKRFFLAQRLEEVLIQASNRLRVLSEGRFELLLDKKAADGRIGAGLDLRVGDGFTGTDRPVNTLSGGQMFLASLSMALGLADVVQARSGGIRLDTLFVDEGFGSLDDETLQVALKVLNELRKGRMVGVISHVEELKRQIEKKIEVQGSGAGSTLKMVF